MDKKLEQFFYAALGGALAVKEKLEANSEEIKAWQEKSEEHARSFFDELAKRGEKEKDQFKGMIRDIVKEVIVELNLASKDDLKKLKRELSKKVDS
jgi:polyhydroxyalkanoate synthesis regulator phasin